VFCCSLAFAAAALASAILAKSSLTFDSASAVSDSRNTMHFNAPVSSAAAFNTSVSGVTCGLVMYWWLKNTKSLTFVALVFTMYT
jgi:hypothetical protein